MNPSRIAQITARIRAHLSRLIESIKARALPVARQLSHTVRAVWSQRKALSVATIMRGLGKAWACTAFSFQKVIRRSKSGAPGESNHWWSALSISHGIVAGCTALVVCIVSSSYFATQGQRKENHLREEFRQKEQRTQTEWQSRMDTLKRDHEATLAMVQREMDRRVSAAQSEAASRVTAIESQSASKIAEAQRRSAAAAATNYRPSSSSSPNLSSTFGKALIERATKEEPVYREEQCRACSATGQIECATCKGGGKVTCKECRLGTQSCDECDGEGTVTKGFFTKETVLCSKCRGSKRMTCPECKGTTMVDCGFWFGCNGTGKRSCPKCVAGKIKLRVN